MVLDFVNNGPENYDSYEKVFNELYVKIFKHLNLNGDYMTDVTIVNNKEIHKINREYRNVDRPTDVISFAFLDEESEKELKGGPISLGQIIISYEKAEEQAKEYGHSLLREMSFLFTHGMLHLLGYDHMEKEDEVVMFKLQDEILGGLK
ncbi:MAG: rRNA maturation RNase YbeY [Bacilli bacterium]|nr:rRNA maturation RNase YbeY [Bacilli bacterium]